MTQVIIKDFRNPLQPDETNQASKTLKIKFPSKNQIRDYIIWKPILSEEIQVFERIAINGDEDWNVSMQKNRKINRNVIIDWLDLEEFMWKQITLPENEDSCCPVLYNQIMEIPIAEQHRIIFYKYTIQKLSDIAHKIIALKNKPKEQQTVQEQQPQFTANNHLILKLFHHTEVAEKNYNKYQYPDYPNSEKERNNIDLERSEWFKTGIFEDATRLKQIFNSFPAIDQELFDDYKEICDKLMKLKKETDNKHIKSQKLALFYDMILIATRRLPNKINYIEEETESPDFGKLKEKDG